MEVFIKLEQSDALLTLDRLGIVFAVCLGALLLYLGGSMGIFFLAGMIWFLVISTIVTVTGKERKMKLKLYQEARGWRNVVANGLIPLVVVALYAFDQGSHFISPAILVVSYVASVAAVAADKFGSELGVLGRSRPITLLTLKPSKIGVSGGVTLMGVLAGVVGAALISLMLVGYGNYPFYMTIVIISGLVGTLVDSVFGYFEEKGVGNKFTSNLMGGLAGCLLCMLVLIHI